MRAFNKNDIVTGKSVYLRAATGADAAFVFEMRSDEKNSKYLKKIEGTIADQKAWLDKSYADPYQFYFVVCSLSHDPLGLVRVYDQRGDSFSWGSWLVKRGAPLTTALESALLIYRFALAQGFTQSHFEVRIGNESVINFHRMSGAVETGRSSDDVFFNIGIDAIREFMRRFKVFLPIPPG